MEENGHQEAENLKGLGMNDRKGLTNYIVSDLGVESIT